MQFITPCERTRYLLALEDQCEMEYTNDFNSIIASKKPVLLWNYYSWLRPGNFSDKIKYDVWQYYKQNNLPIYCMERGGLPNTVYFDSNGFCSESKSYLKWEEHSINPRIKDYIDNLKFSNDSLEKQKSERLLSEQLYNKLNIKNFTKVIFVPLQVRLDTTILVGSDVNVEEFLLFVIAFSKLHPEYLFLVKSHPLDKLSIPTSDNLIDVEDVHYKDCISISDIIVCINSGVGLQALAWNKPVFTFGRSFYTHPTLAKASSWRTLESDLDYHPNEDNILKFYSFLIYSFYTACNTQTYKLLEPIRLI